jgi:mannose-6-phosphate isomerase-like protein (cupin superfamily)
MTFETKGLPVKPDYLAPDGSEIRKLPDVKGGGLCHCTLPPYSTSQAVTHKTVYEIWYVIEGHGKVWRKFGEQDQTVDVHPGLSLTIPVDTRFQFRNTGSDPLCFIIATMPPWPGP